LFAKAVLPKQENADAAAIEKLDDDSMRLYAQAQKDTGVPWVVLMAVDRAQRVHPDAARVRTVAEVYVGAHAAEKGLFLSPAANAAQIAGLYSGDRKTIERIAKQLLSLDKVYTLVQAGRFPADAGVVTQTETGCRIAGITQARSPFAGTVTGVADGTVNVDCDNGLRVRLFEITAPSVKPGDRVRAGDPVGNTTVVSVAFFHGNRAIDPYPFLVLWC
jgi:biotin carboxyl carrier protein